MRCRYNAVNFLPNPHNRHPIACLWGRDMGCPLWMITLIYVLLQSLTVVMCATSCYIGLCYNGTWRYHSWRYHSWYNLHNVTPCLANSHTSIAINTLRRRYYVVIYFEYIFLKKKSTYILKFYWNLFLGVQLAINQHWFRQKLGGEQARGHYLNQWRPNLLTHLCVTWLR